MFVLLGVETEDDKERTQKNLKRPSAAVVVFLI